MRIIGGNLRGKKILNPTDKSTRPLKDMVRESVFNIIEHSKNEYVELNNAKVLDLFSGTGSFGIECLSRGAKKVIFFENYKPTIELLIKNINSLKFNKQTEINKNNIYEDSYFKKLNYKFDLVFLDPPFKDDNWKLVLENLIKSKALNANTLIIIHRHKKTIENFNKNFKIAREEIYGASKIIFGFFIF